jgi:hypothetical protein
MIIDKKRKKNSALIFHHQGFVICPEFSGKAEKAHDHQNIKRINSNFTLLEFSVAFERQLIANNKSFNHLKSILGSTMT